LPLSLIRRVEQLFDPVRFPMEDPVEYYEMSRKQRNNPLFNCLGMKDPVIFTLEKDVVLRKGSRLLLCTDGLYRYLPYPDLLEIATRGESPENTVDKLFKKALANMRSSGDNIAIVFYEHCP
jgi:serine/threonine protein phosphatase PrpC